MDAQRFDVRPAPRTVPLPGPAYHDFAAVSIPRKGSEIHHGLYTPRSSEEIKPCTAKQLQEALRTYASRGTVSPNIFNIELGEYGELLRSCEDLAQDDPLYGFWYDKLRYDYDSETCKFRIYMTPSIPHEEVAKYISRRIDRYIEEACQSESNAVRSLGEQIRYRASAGLEYTKKKDPDYVRSSSSSSSDDQQTEGSSIPARELKELGSSSISQGPRTKRVTGHPNTEINDPTNQSETSVSSQSSDEEKRYSPDDAWRMDAEDEGGLVLEVSHSQPDTSLDEKIRGLIFKCNVQAVLAVRVHDYNNKGACIELWCPDTDEESRAMIYHKDFLDAEGRLESSAANDTANIKLTHFFNPRNVDNLDTKQFRSVIEYTSLRLDLRELGDILIAARRSEADKKRRKQEKKRLKRAGIPEAPPRKRAAADEERDRAFKRSNMNP